MQKVILLPRMSEYKRCLFTKRVVAINQSFVPVWKNKRFPATGDGTRAYQVDMTRMSQVPM